MRETPLRPTWHLVTGEYPPQPGGVGDYSRAVARGLAACGDAVTVWAPQADGPTPNDPGIVVRRLPGQFGPPALAILDRALVRAPGRVLVQYTPHAFGWKAMNLPLCAWLWARPRTLDVMFHEVAYPREPGQAWPHRLLAATNRGMAFLLLRAAQRVFVSIPGWEPILRDVAARHPRPQWMPVPSNLPIDCAEEEVAAVRRRCVVGPVRWLVGHFGTYGPLVRPLLEPALASLLTEAPSVCCLLLGQGSAEFAGRFLRQRPQLVGQVHAPGALAPHAAAVQLAACDVLLQPYPDGICTRRGSAMAGLALGRPIVTTDGRFTELLWRTQHAVALAAPAELAHTTIALLDDTPRRAALGRNAAAVYRAQFAIEHTIRALRQVERDSPAALAV